MKSLDRLHPSVTFAYFIAAAAFAMCFLNPIYQAASVICAAACCILRGKGKIILPAASVAFMAALINILFNHRGATVLFYIGGANAVTAQSAVYSLCSAMMICSVILWFSCFCSVITSDKLIYLTGRAAPTLSLLLSMILRFVPLFRMRIKKISDASSSIDGAAQGGIIKKIRTAASVLSAAVTWSLEEALQTADSMKSRGYASAKRTSFSIYTFSRRDAFMLSAVLIIITVIIGASALGVAHFECYPRVRLAAVSPISTGATVIYIVYCTAPLIFCLIDKKKNGEKDGLL